MPATSRSTKRQQQERAWTRHAAPLVRHRTVVLGTGAMGSEIAAWMERVGFVVRGWNRRSGETLLEALATAEIVVCALPLTPATEGLLGAAAFAAHAARRPTSSTSRAAPTSSSRS